MLLLYLLSVIFIYRAKQAMILIHFMFKTIREIIIIMYKINICYYLNYKVKIEPDCFKSHFHICNEKLNKNLH